MCVFVFIYPDWIGSQEKFFFGWRGRCSWHVWWVPLWNSHKVSGQVLSTMPCTGELNHTNSHMMCKHQGHHIISPRGFCPKVGTRSIILCGQYRVRLELWIDRDEFIENGNWVYNHRFVGSDREYRITLNYPVTRLVREPRNVLLYYVLLVKVVLNV